MAGKSHTHTHCREERCLAYGAQVSKDYAHPQHYGRKEFEAGQKNDFVLIFEQINSLLLFSITFKLQYNHSAWNTVTWKHSY